MSYAGFCEKCQIPYYEMDALAHQHSQGPTTKPVTPLLEALRKEITDAQLQARFSAKPLASEVAPGDFHAGGCNEHCKPPHFHFYHAQTDPQGAEAPADFIGFSDWYWDVFIAGDGGRLLRLCGKNASGNFMAMEVAEFCTWNAVDEQRQAEEFLLSALEMKKRDRKWLLKRAKGEDETMFSAAPRPQQPRCPECESPNLSLAFNFQGVRVACEKSHVTRIFYARDMLRFFSTAQLDPGEEFKLKQAPAQSQGAAPQCKVCGTFMTHKITNLEKHTGYYYCDSCGATTSCTEGDKK